MTQNNNSIATACVNISEQMTQTRPTQMLYWRKYKHNNCHKVHPSTPTPYFYRFPQYTSLYYSQKEKAFSTPILFMNIKMQSVQYSIQSIHISMQIFV